MMALEVTLSSSIVFQRIRVNTYMCEDRIENPVHRDSHLSSLHKLRYSKGLFYPNLTLVIYETCFMFLNCLDQYRGIRLPMYIEGLQS